MNFKIIYIYLLTLLVQLNIFGQKKILSVEYSVKIEQDVLMNSNDNFKSMLEEVISKEKNYSFTLLINNKSAKFFNNPILVSDRGRFSDKAIFIFLSYSGTTYSFKDTVLVQSPRLGSNAFVRRNKLPEWSITNESKYIDNYKCFKATNTKVVIGIDKVFNFPIAAWFCPDLPYSYGPNGYGGLPGLILELQVRNAVFGVKKINLNSNLHFTLDEISNVKIFTQEQADEFIDAEMRK